jgi:hypothetical protein
MRAPRCMPSLTATRWERSFRGWMIEMISVASGRSNASSRAAIGASVASPCPHAERAKRQPSSGAGPGGERSRAL